jgi:multicomponent Na+:H+ antiporter subunit F
MSPDPILLVIAVVLAAAAIPTVYRMIIGPTILDRAVASDMLIVLVVAGMALYTASTGTEYAIAPMLGLTGLAFVATLSVARFVSREKPATGMVLRQRDPDSQPAGDEEPEQDADPGLAPDVEDDTAPAPFTDDGAHPLEDQDDSLIAQEEAEGIDPPHGEHSTAGGAAPRLPGPAADAHEGEEDR